MSNMSEVARRAGVSTATVSRVLSGLEESVRPETREKVLAAVAEMGYYPNRLGRNLRERSARMVAIVVSDIGNPFFTAIVRGCEDVTKLHQHSTIFSSTDEVVEFEAQRLLDMVAEGVSGIILASTGRQNDGLAQVVKSNIPVVALDRRIPGGDFDTVTTNGLGGAKDAVDLLIKRGHRRIAMIGGESSLSTMADRRSGYEKALRDAGLGVDPDLFRVGDLIRQDSGHTATLSLLDLAEPPTALFVASNLMALGALRATAERGLTVPGDVSIICFDDLLGSDLIGPGLSAVVQPTYDMGAAAAELLFRRIDDPSLPSREVVFGTQVVARGSVAEAPEKSRPA